MHFADQGVRADVWAGKEARGNFYFAARSGVMKTPTGATLYRAGLRASEIAIADVQYGSGSLLTTGQQVAYRAVFVGTDANGVITRSRPTGAVLVQAPSTCAPYLALYVDAHPVGQFASRLVEVYRTRIFPAGVQVDDEMQLVAMLPVPTASGQNGVGFVDKVPDINRGTSLYTSPSRGGIQAANDRPPGCACLERFRSSLFFGNTIGSQTYKVSYKWSTALAGSATGTGTRTVTGTVTASSNQITSISNTAGLQVGQFIVSTTAGQLGYITAIAGSTVTSSYVAPAFGAGAQSINFIDAIWLDSPTNTAGTLNFFVLGGPGGTWDTTSAAITASRYSGYEVTPPEPGYDGTFVFEYNARGGSPFRVRATHGDEMSPALPLASVAASSGLLSSVDIIPNGLAWSEPDEPEHVPPKNFARVGDTGKAILALVATKDRLLIFKEDGLFMLTGDTAANFAIYPLDTTALCILPGSVRRLQNTVYALTNLGLIAVDEGGGVNIVSRAIQTEIAPIVTQIRQAQKASGLYLMPGLSGVTGTADDANGEYMMLLGTTTPSFGGQALVWHAFKQGFTTYSFGSPAPVAVAQDGEGQPLVLTASTLLTPSTGLGAITARISPHAFSDPALVGKMWTHITAGFSRLTGTTSVQAKFSSSESQVDGASVTETIPLPTLSGLVELPGGSLVRHPVPAAMKRAFLSFVELIVAVSTGTFVLELIGAESRENIANKPPSHGSGST